MTLEEEIANLLKQFPILCVFNTDGLNEYGKKVLKDIMKIIEKHK